MLDEDLIIKLEGFESDADFGSFLKGIVEGLSLESPSVSTISASFSKAGGITSGKIEINSSEGVFSAQDQGRNSREIVLHVAQEIRNQLNHWKKKRKHALANSATPDKSLADL